MADDIKKFHLDTPKKQAHHDLIHALSGVLERAELMGLLSHDEVADTARTVVTTRRRMHDLNACRAQVDRDNAA